VTGNNIHLDTKLGAISSFGFLILTQLVFPITELSDKETIVYF